MKKVFCVFIFFVISLTSLNLVSVSAYSNSLQTNEQHIALYNTSVDYEKEYTSFLQAYYDNLSYNYGMNY